MGELLPTRQAQDITESLLDYLTTTFALADDDARLALLEFLGDEDNGLFKGLFCGCGCRSGRRLRQTRPARHAVHSRH